MKDAVEIPKERDIQKAIFSHFAARAADGVVAYHPKNSSSDHGSPHRAKLSVAMGVLPGIPDIVATKQIGGDDETLLRCFALELKRENRRGKKPTDHEQKQATCREMLEDSGWTCGVAYGLNEALQWLEDHKLLVGSAR